MASPPRATFGLIAAIAAAAMAVTVLAPRLLGTAAGSEAQILSQLKKTEGRGTFRLEISGTPVLLEATRHHYDRVTVSVDASARKATAVATLDFTGKLGTTEVSSLGLERVEFAYQDGEWHPVRGFAPSLVGVVSALEARRQVLERADTQRLGSLSEQGIRILTARADSLKRLWEMQTREYRALAWYIRIEPSEVQVTEHYHLRGSAPDRPVDEKGARALVLKQREQEFFFSSELM